NSSLAQFENTDIGARAIGLNGAFTSLSDNSLAVFYNPSGLGQMKYREVSAFYSPSTFGVTQITTAALTYAEPLKIGTLGLGLKTFGFDLYKETNVILSYGNNFRDKIFYGVSLNYYNLRIHNYNSASSFGVDAGAIACITDLFKWGFFAKNVSGSKIGVSDQKLAQVYRTGVTIMPREDITLVFDIEKDVKYPLSFRSGLEFNVNDHIDLRAGVGTQPSSFSGGISINYDLFKLDYAISGVQNLGVTNYGSITINFGGSKRRKN
ncbi:MAG: hypothetical protein M3P82_04840, partial [Bacteroidota bacterium]|nr:hypothetical protein [Bacteroidota bacterium]